MGYNNPLAERHRAEFPVTGNLIYVNHAAVAPLCKPAADAMAWQAGNWTGRPVYSETGAFGGCRMSAARRMAGRM